LIVSEDSFLLTDRTVDPLSEETLPGGISSSSIIAASALFLPLIVLAADAGDDGWPLLFPAKDSGLFASPTFRIGPSFFGGGGGEGVTTTEAVVDAVDFTDAIDGDRFATPGANLSTSGVEGPLALPVVEAATEGGRFVLAVAVVEATEDVDGTLGLLIIVLPVDGP